METFPALLALCEGIHQSSVNSPHKGQWRGALMFSLYKQLRKPSRRRWFEMPSRSLWCHCNGFVYYVLIYWHHDKEASLHALPIAPINNMVWGTGGTKWNKHSLKPEITFWSHFGQQLRIITDPGECFSIKMPFYQFMIYSTMRIPKLVREHLFIELAPRSLWDWYKL